MTMVMQADAGMVAQDTWVEVCGVEDIPRRGARVVADEGGDIAVFRTADDEYFALRDCCPHRGGPLSQGIVFGRRVACPLHDWVIDLGTGCATGPDKGCTGRFALRIESSRVWLCVTPVPAADPGIDEA